MNLIQKLVTSSEDPQKVSLFIKNVLAFAVLFGLDKTIAESLQGMIGNIILGGGMIYTAILGFYGLYRKARLGRWSAPTFSTEG